MKEKTATKAIRTLNPLVLIFILILCAALLTYIIPAGSFDRADVDGRAVVVADSFHKVDSNPVSIGTFLTSFNGGIQATAGIIAFLILIGGAFGVVNSTGAISALMAKLVSKFKSQRGQGFLIFALMAFFLICAGTFGMFLESLVFVPFLIALMVKMGYDPLVGVAIPIVGCSIGYGAAYMNPFTLGIAQGIAELPFTSGITVRIILMVLYLLISAFFLIRYAKKVKNDPSKSYCLAGSYDLEKVDDSGTEELTAARKRVLFVFVASIIWLIYGTSFRSYYMAQCSTVFLVMGILAGFAYKMHPSEIASAFVNGAKDMIMPCLIVGFARAITLLMEGGMIMDTIVYYLSMPLQSFPPVLSAPLMVLLQTIVNFFINSGSAQAMVMMPLMIPIADIIEVNRQVAVLAFQIGDGLSNMFWVTSSFVLIGIGMAKVTYSQWVKFVGKIFLANLAVGMIVVTLAQLLNWGPF